MLLVSSKRQKGGKKDLKKKDGINRGKKDLSKVMCFRCHGMGHYVRQCPLNKNGKGEKQVATKTVEGAEQLTSQFEIAFSMDSCLSTNMVSSVGQYVDSGALRHMTDDR